MTETKVKPEQVKPDDYIMSERLTRYTKELLQWMLRYMKRVDVELCLRYTLASFGVMPPLDAPVSERIFHYSQKSIRWLEKRLVRNELVQVLRHGFFLMKVSTDK